MKTKVSEQGLMIPREWLEGVEEVEICKEADRILIIPATARDPILDLGTSPVKCGLQDASADPDRYLYDTAS